MTAGVLNAASLAAASQQLRDRGQYILALAVTDEGKPKSAIWQMSFSFGPSAKDVQAFTSQLAVMIRAGISLRAALDGISDQVHNVKFKKILLVIKNDVESGKQFSEAIAKYPKLFGPLYQNMVRASEMSGSFAKMLDRIAAFVSRP